MKFDEKYIKLAYKFLLAITEQFIVYDARLTKVNDNEPLIETDSHNFLAKDEQYRSHDEFPALQGFGDLLVLKGANSSAKYEALIEFKYIKKSDATEPKIEEELANGITQIERYMEDERLANRPDLKKFVIVFSGFDVVKIQEI